MTDRRHFFGNTEADPELVKLIEKARETKVDEAMLREQRISFAYGNAFGEAGITKESVRKAAQSIRLNPA